MTIEADAIIEDVKVDGLVPTWLDQVLHGLTWHGALHTPLWITRNPEIVRKYAQYDELNESERETLKRELEKSVEILRSY